MKLPKIFLKALSATFVLVIIYVLFIFLFFIPRIEKNTTHLEDTIGKVQLEKTLQIIRGSAQELEDYQQVLLQQHKRELKKLTDVVWSIIVAKAKGHSPKSLPEIKTETLKLVSQLQYANHDYFYISDYNSTLISHPYLKDRDFSKITDMHGNLIVPSLVKIAKEKGEGYYRYWWKKNSKDTTPYEKLTYARNFAPWKWVLGTGVYIDDIQKGIDLRKKKLITRLKRILRSTKIGKSGYVYIFDSSGNMIIHPSTNLEGENFKKWKNPERGSYIFDDLINAYKYGDKVLYYRWNTPEDKENFSYKKISWIEYDPYFDWYICSSGYLNEFHQDSKHLKNFIIYSAMMMTLLLTILGLYFLRQILRPLVKLSANAKEVIAGNLHARYEGEITNDETGLLALQFNQMLDTIDEQIVTLDKQVQMKTEKLSIALNEKELLLKELNHRVKNNMYVISSIIGLQTFKIKNIDLDVFIKTVQHRIHSMALGHEMLSRSGDFDSVNMQEYIPKLVNSLMDAYLENPESCECEYLLDPIKIDLDRLLSCGLIINELVTNVLKYAFTVANNKLTISFKKIDQQIYLSIVDNGKCFDSREKSGIGLELVEMLAFQLNGEIEFLCEDGLHVIVSFPY